MTPSKRCADFIKGYEKCRLRAYMPTPDDVPTIGWGSTGPDIKLGMTWTQEQADARFTIDLARFARAVAVAVTHPANQAQFDAMTSLAYNIGKTAFVNSTLLRKHNQGDHDGAAEQFGKWVKQKGRTLGGLVKRRAAEAEIYKGEA